MIHVIAVITAKAGKRSELLDAFSKIVPTVHNEQGCVAYEPVIDAEEAGEMQTKLGEDTFVVVEKWSTMDDLKAHSASSHMAEYAKTASHLIADRKIHVLS